MRVVTGGSTVRLKLVWPAMLAVLAIAVPAAYASSETLYLDSHDLVNDGAAGPVSTVKPLTANRYYLVAVAGTYSDWTKAEWLAGPGCGRYESGPIFPSPGVANGRAGIDAETVFAGPPNTFACRDNATVPRHIDAFKIDTGAGPVHKEPLFGPFNRPVPWHVYFYLLKGQGTAASFKFSLSDFPTTDNYGRLKIFVRGSDKDDCKDGGWKDFSGYKNQGDCVSHNVPDKDW
jgi:hypothetical protein